MNEMSVVLVTGGTGVLGSRAVTLLRSRGHEVRVLSRRQGRGTHAGDLATGEGVKVAARGAELVLHAASDVRHQGKSDAEQTRCLLDVSGDARHVLYVSIVGVDLVPFGYYGRKLACEQQLAASGTPHTIVRATQFHELLERTVRSAARFPVVPVPLRWRLQPVAAAEVAQRVVELLEQDARGRAADFGGPEVLALGQIVDAWREHRQPPRFVLPVRIPGRLSRGVRQGALTCPDHAGGAQTWAAFLRADERFN